MMKSSAYTPVYTHDDDYANTAAAAAAESECLEEGLIGAAPPAGTLQAVGQSLIEVTAPATLPEGYEFTVVSGHLKFNVRVPPGGVEEGQKFSVAMPVQHQSPLTTHMVSIPVGHWRDGLWSLFNYGVCHPHCWTACLCPLCKFPHQIRDVTSFPFCE